MMGQEQNIEGMTERTGAVTRAPIVPASIPFINRYLIVDLVVHGKENPMNPTTTATFVQNRIFEPA